MTPTLNYVSSNKRVCLILMLNESDFLALDRTRNGADLDGHDGASSGERLAQRYLSAESWPKKPNIVYDVSQRNDLSDTIVDVRTFITGNAPIRVAPYGRSLN